MTTGKGGDFAPVAADGHRAPAAPVRRRGIVEEKAAPRVGAQTQPRLRSFGNRFGRRTRHRGEQPLESTLPGHEFDFPLSLARQKFFMPFGDAQDFVDRLDPFPDDPLPVEERIEGQAQSGAKPLGFAEKRLSRLRITAAQGQQFPAALGGDDLGALEESNQLVPGQFRAPRDDVDEIESQAAGNEPEGGLAGSGHNSFTVA